MRGLRFSGKIGARIFGVGRVRGGQVNCRGGEGTPVLEARGNALCSLSHFFPRFFLLFMLKISNPAGPPGQLPRNFGAITPTVS